ncbi:porin, partial [Sutterella massiliensis]|nr:porin [Sutterella massiliensis]
MKFSLKAAAAALAVSAAFSFQTQAADVKMYGIIDTGIIVENNKMGTGDSSTWA